MELETRDLKIPDEVVESWQKTVNITADMMGVSAGLIMKLDPPYIEVFSSSQSEENPYQVGDRKKLNGLYCAEVIKNDDKILIPNAKKSAKWKDNPNLKHGMISYLGYPLKWPDGSIFGTICVLDRRENPYSQQMEELLVQFKELVETHLQVTYQNYRLSKEVTAGRKKEEQLSTILYSIGDGVIATDVNGIIKVMNPVAAELTGWRIEEAEGQPLSNVFQVFTTDGKPREENPISLAMTEGRVACNASILRSREGKEYQIACSVSPIKEPDKNTLGVVLVFKDMTENYQLQEKIRKREETFSVLLANLPGVVYRCKNDRNWTMTFLSKACEELTGYNQAELINNKSTSYGSLICPGHQEKVQEQVQKALDNKRPFIIEYKIQTKNNQEKWVWEQGQGVYDDEGELKGILGFITDISEKKTIDNRLKEENSWLMSLFENSSDPIVSIDQNHCVLEVNKRFEEVFKYRHEEIKGKDFDDVLDTRKPLVADREVTKKLLQGIKIETEGTRYSKYGDPIECIIKGIPVMVDDKFVGGYGIYIDITEQKEREKELKEKNIELQASYEELTAYNQEITAINEELDASVKEINKLNERFVKMIDVVSNLHKSTLDTDNRFLEDLLKTAIKIVPEADYGGIYVVDEEDKWRIVDTVGHDIDLLKTVQLDKEMLHHYNKQGICITPDYSMNISRLSDEQRAIVKKALRPVSSSIYVNITADGEIVGRITLNTAKGVSEKFSPATEKLLNSFASLASAFFAFQRYNNLQSQFTREFITAIVEILELYDRYTSGHSENVARMGMDLAKALGLSPKDIDATYWAGMVHDIGKLLIPLEILNKKGSLSDAEYELMKKHPYWSFKALSKSKSLNSIAKYVLHHHERWDGKGYPEGLKGEKIPLVSQILILVDAWDAMTSHRSYRAPLSRDAALQEIISNSGTQFSPEVVASFIKYLKVNRDTF